jgi:hypothetical protein
MKSRFYIDSPVADSRFPIPDPLKLASIQATTSPWFDRSSNIPWLSSFQKTRAIVRRYSFQVACTQVSNAVRLNHAPPLKATLALESGGQKSK